MGKRKVRFESQHISYYEKPCTVGQLSFTNLNSIEHVVERKLQLKLSKEIEVQLSYSKRSSYKKKKKKKTGWIMIPAETTRI